MPRVVLKGNLRFIFETLFQLCNEQKNKKSLEYILPCKIEAFSFVHKESNPSTVHRIALKETFRFVSETIFQPLQGAPLHWMEME